MVAIDEAATSDDDFYSRHEALEVLGRGLSSVVRKCLHRDTGQMHAVKIIDITDSSIDKEGFTEAQNVHREIQILRAVSGHPYIIQLLDVYTKPNFVFLIFELCEKGELYQHLNNQVRLSEKRVRAYMKQVLEAVLHCHNMGYVHRDLKPENILLSDDLSSVKITDFGLARHLEKGEKLYSLCGTPGYLAPESLRTAMYEEGHAYCTGYSFPVDAWACGVIMYTLLVGRPPFWHRNQLKMIRQICDSPHSFVGNEWTDITDESKELIDLFLDKNQDTRITIAEALKHDVFQRTSFHHPLLPSFLENDNDNKDDEEEVSDDSPPRIEVHLVSQPDVDEEMTDRPPSPKTSLKSLKSLPSLPPRQTTSQHSMRLQRQRTMMMKFDARRKFKCLANCIRFLVRLNKIKQVPELIRVELSRRNPYVIRGYRKNVDLWTFTLYAHWVKRNDGQNRAAMFQHRIRIEHPALGKCETCERLTTLARL